MLTGTSASNNFMKLYTGSTLLTLLLCGISIGTAGCSGSSDATQPGTPDAGAPLSELAQVGELIFHDASLSASGQQSCATCHVEERALAGNDATPAPPGGADMSLPGLRNTPSLRYLRFNPAFGFDAEGTPTGGFTRDGRANSLAAQARTPFLAPFEMANASAADVAARLAGAAYAQRFRALFGEAIFDDPDAAFDRALQALQAYQLEDRAGFAPFSSKFDRYLAGTAELSPAELRGFALFNDPAKGNCAACHPGTRSADGTPPLFTDFTYDNLGVPRNPDIPANADPAYFDLGLCGPLREDLANRPDLCGAFKVPSLRNVAITAPYFHNGRFQTLREVVRFYVRRDTHPAEWYPLDAAGNVRKFDDLPPGYGVNVNRTEAPYNRNVGDVPALTDDEIDDVVDFLGTLTDGYAP